MIPSQALFERAFVLLGADTTTLAKSSGSGNVIMLIKEPFTPASNLDPTALDEADFTGYAAETLTAWNTPILAPGTGYMIGSPLVQFEVGAAPSVTNVINGCYLVDAAGDLRMVVIFTSPIPMQLDGQGLPINLVWLFPTGL